MHMRILTDFSDWEGVRGGGVSGQRENLAACATGPGSFANIVIHRDVQLNSGIAHCMFSIVYHRELVAISVR